MKNFRMGIIGFGKMGMLHGALAAALDSVDVVAVTERSWPVRLAAGRLLPGVKTYGDHRKMLDRSSLDAVLVTTPIFHHRDATIDALSRNMAVFVEKPPAATVDDALKMRNASRSAGRPVQVGFCSRFMPAIAQAKAIHDSGKLGAIRKVDARSYSGDVLAASGGWRFNPAIAGGGVLLDFGIHLVDILFWIFGTPDLVEGKTRSIHSSAVEDEYQGCLLYPNNMTVDFETSWSRPEFRKPDMSVTIEGQYATLTFTNQTVECVPVDGSPERFTAPDLYRGDYIDIGGIHFSRQMKSFFETLSDGAVRSPAAGIEDALTVQSIIAAMYESARAGRPVTLSKEVA